MKILYNFGVKSREESSISFFREGGNNWNFWPKYLPLSQTQGSDIKLMIFKVIIRSSEALRKFVDIHSAVLHNENHYLVPCPNDSCLASF